MPRFEITDGVDMVGLVLGFRWECARLWCPLFPYVTDGRKVAAEPGVFITSYLALVVQKSSPD